MNSRRLERDLHTSIYVRPQINRCSLGDERLEGHVLNTDVNLVENTLVDNDPYNIRKRVEDARFQGLQAVQGISRSDGDAALAIMVWTTDLDGLWRISRIVAYLSCLMLPSEIAT